MHPVGERATQLEARNAGQAYAIPESTVGEQVVVLALIPAAIREERLVEVRMRPLFPCSARSKRTRSSRSRRAAAIMAALFHTWRLDIPSSYEEMSATLGAMR